MPPKNAQRSIDREKWKFTASESESDGGSNVLRTHAAYKRIIVRHESAGTSNAQWRLRLRHSQASYAGNKADYMAQWKRDQSLQRYGTYPHPTAWKGITNGEGWVIDYSELSPTRMWGLFSYWNGNQNHEDHARLWRDSHPSSMGE